MSRENEKPKIIRDIAILMPIFIVIYFGVILFKYLSNDDLTWFSTFVTIFVIGTIVFILSRAKRKRVNE